MMAYLAFADLASGTAVNGANRPIGSPVAEPVAFSALEWSVVAVARRDRLSSLRQPGRIATAVAALFGVRRNPRLADEKLEALRRLAVLGWHYSYAVPAAAVRSFVAAGWSLDHYETLLKSISADRSARPRRLAA